MKSSIELSSNTSGVVSVLIWELLSIIILSIQLSGISSIVNPIIYLATSSLKLFAGLNDGMLCSGIMRVVFLLMLRAVLAARFLTVNEPKPRR